ncbi:MAG: polyribonucleotide nucleotidyltransferase, partial [Elusimicrobiota bacterium]|nr:polyribonucleotide nucleotidyltransferase [Elusimicrobiota bacterium]
MLELKKNIVINERLLSFSTGLIAKQANGSIIAQYGDTVVLATFVYKDLPQEMKGADFVPLMVDYRERSYAAGKIPGGFFKREGRPKDSEILASRLIDRPIRPLFPDNIGKELSVNVLVLSYDGENSADVLGIIASSLAITMTGVPFSGPIGAVRIGYIDDKFIVNPNEKIMQNSLLDLVVVGTEDKITMIESNSMELSEEIMLRAFAIAHEEIIKIVKLQKEFIQELGVQKQEINSDKNEIIDIQKTVNDIYEKKQNEIKEKLLIFEKLKRQYALDEFKESLKNIEIFSLIEEENKNTIISVIYEKLIQRAFRELINKDKKRPDGRALDEIRPIACQIGVLPSRVHGSSLFTRGETQSLGTVSLGNMKDEQILDELAGESKKRFMLHYNFPSFSVGETKMSRGPGRREIG